MRFRKTILAITLVFFSVLFYVSARAQQPVPAVTVYKQVDLGVSAVYIPCENPVPTPTTPPVPPCTAYPTNVPTHPDPIHIDHEYNLSGRNLPANTDVIIVGCVNTDKGARCTSGDTALDAQLNNAAGDRMDPDPTYQFKVLNNPVKTTATGTLENVIARSFTPDFTYHSFKGYYLTNAGTTVSPTVASSEAVITPQGQQQQRLLLPTPTSPPSVGFSFGFVLGN